SSDPRYLHSFPTRRSSDMSTPAKYMALPTFSLGSGRFPRPIQVSTLRFTRGIQHAVSPTCSFETSCMGRAPLLLTGQLRASQGGSMERPTVTRRLDCLKWNSYVVVKGQ